MVTIALTRRAAALATMGLLMMSQSSAAAADTPGRTKIHQSPEFIAAKMAGTVAPPWRQGVAVPMAWTGSAILDYSATQYFEEPVTTSLTSKRNDAAGQWYTDINYANMCTDGSVAIMERYWQLNHESQVHPAVVATQGSFLDPYKSADWPKLQGGGPKFKNQSSGSYWGWLDTVDGFGHNVFGRGYMMYISMTP